MGRAEIRRAMKNEKKAKTASAHFYILKMGFWSEKVGVGQNWVDFWSSL